MLIILNRIKKSRKTRKRFKLINFIALNGRSVNIFYTYYFKYKIPNYRITDKKSTRYLKYIKHFNKKCDKVLIISFFRKVLI